MDALSIVTSTTASSGGGTSDTKEEDSAERFSVEILSGHANVPGVVAAPFETDYDEGDTDAIVSALPDDASSAVAATVTWKPERT